MPANASHLGATWNKAYKKLLDFAGKQGHLRVPETLAVDGVPLSKWKSNQISRYRNKTLSHEKIRFLERIPGWSWSIVDENWERHYKAFLAFVSREGHTRVPDDHLEADCALGVWVQAQRRSFSQGALEAKQIDLLEKLPAWQWTEPEPEPPAEFLEESQADEESRPLASPPHSAPLPRHPAIEDIRLIRPLRPHPQARKVRKRSGFPAGWRRGHLALATFARREGHVDVPPGHLENTFPLGEWVMNQRAAYSRGELPHKLASALRGIPGWTFRQKKSVQKDPTVKKERKKPARGPRKAASSPVKAREDWNWESTGLTWDEVCTRLEAIADAQGTLIVPRGRPQEPSESPKTWILRQKQAYKKGELPMDRRRRLESLPGFFSQAEQDKTWHNTFEHLWFFIRKEKHAQVPIDHQVEGVPLGEWVADQRRLYHQGHLPDLCLRKLETLPQWTWTPEPTPCLK
jgi:hypothetical protein